MLCCPLWHNVAFSQVAKWLVAAGADVNHHTAPEAVTPLHLACVGGIKPLVRYLLEQGADPNVLSSQNKSPLVYCLAYGHTEAAALLVQSGAELDQEDIHGVTPRDLLTHRGSVSAVDALTLFNITQKPVRTLEQRPLHPEYPTSAPVAAKDNGGWDRTRLKGFEHDMHCDVDQYELDEISGVDLFEQYIARQRPVLLRAGTALAANWSALEHYSRVALVKEHGDEVVKASSIPYSGE